MKHPFVSVLSAVWIGLSWVLLDLVAGRERSSIPVYLLFCNIVLAFRFVWNVFPGLTAIRLVTPAVVVDHGDLSPGEMRKAIRWVRFSIVRCLLLLSVGLLVGVSLTRRSLILGLAFLAGSALVRVLFLWKGPSFNRGDLADLKNELAST
jgi:hypothetical protein